MGSGAVRDTKSDTINLKKYSYLMLGYRSVPLYRESCLSVQIQHLLCFAGIYVNFSIQPPQPHPFHKPHARGKGLI